MSEAFRKLEDNRTQQKIPLSKDYYTEDRLASLLPHERARVEQLLKGKRAKWSPRKQSQLTPEQQQYQQQQQQKRREWQDARGATESARLAALGSSLHPSLVRQPTTPTQTIIQKLDIIIQKLNQLVARRGGKRKTRKLRKKRRKGKTKRRR